MNADVEFLIEASEDILVCAVGQVTGFAGGIEVTAVKQRGPFGVRLGGEESGGQEEAYRE
jgi:hypothetical protein